MRSAKELIRDADDKFVQYLSEQLDERHQAQIASEFGFGQGYMVKTSTATAWKRKKERARLTEWLLALGFTAMASVNRYLFRIASLRADIIIHELHRRVLPSLTGYVLPCDGVQFFITMNSIVVLTSSSILL